MMGVNVSKTQERPIIKSKNSENLILVESCHTFSSSNTDSSSISTASLSSLSDEETSQIQSANDNRNRSDNHETKSTNKKLLDNMKPENTVQSFTNHSHCTVTNQIIHSDTASGSKKTTIHPVSDAEKRLCMYGDETKRSKLPENSEILHNSQEIKEDNIKVTRHISVENDLKRPKQTRPHIFMKNDDILRVRRTNVFHDEPFEMLNPVTSKRPGQNDILDQLGKEGIVRPKTVEEKTIGELRTLGILKQRAEENTSKRVGIQRLAPLKVESVWAKVPEAQLKAPWERTHLLKKCSTQDLTPSIRTEDGKTWSGIPFDGATDNSTKIKLKMMDIDLL